jgi:hypothetical protein
VKEKIRKEDHHQLPTQQSSSKGMSDVAFVPIDDGAPPMFVATAPSEQPTQPFQLLQQQQQQQQQHQRLGSVSQPIFTSVPTEHHQHRGSYGALNDTPTITPLATPIGGAAVSPHRLSLAASPTNVAPPSYPITDDTLPPSYPSDNKGNGGNGAVRLSIASAAIHKPIPPASAAPSRQQRRSVDVHNGFEVSDNGDHDDKHPRHGPTTLSRMGTVRDNVEDEQPVEHRPYFVVVVLLANLCMFVYEMSLNDWKFESFATNPMVCLDTQRCHIIERC